MARHPHRPVSRRRFAVIAVAVIAVLALAWIGITRLVSDPAPPPGAPVSVTIPQGSSATQIAELLAEAGVIRDVGGFVEQVVADGLGGGFRPGTYSFRTNEVYRRIVDQLNAGPADTSASQLVIPEGYAIWDIEAAVAEVGITPKQYQQALAGHQPPGDFLEAGEEATTLEGFLFPATYDVGLPTNANQLVKDQLGAFAANIASVDFAYAESRNLTRYDVLKIASLIEREARAPEDRRKVSAIIYNRLRADMPTGMESGIQYATGAWGILTASDLELESPYNLWVRRGLPPTPICNPGLASLKAAANPAKVDYLYMYAIKGDAKGRHYFTNNYDDFLKYQKEHPYP
ncbi:MAG: endolytic transglycosylase MltG [Thermoleophilia bacterium]|nr:endolytic transglycosylase MltG [Thermoleophilia bacterium]